VPPDLVTVSGLLVAGLVAWLSWLGGGWLFLAVTLVVASGLLDGLDGAVAVLTDRATPFGYVLDSLVDRGADLLYLLALVAVGADPRVAAGGGVLMLLQEYTRARAAAGGMTEIGVVTVWERPTRVIVTALFLLGAGLYAASRETWAAAGAWAWLGLGMVGLGQLLVVVRRRLR